MRGRADAGIAIEAVASILGLEFIPIKRERFDLVVLRDEFFSQPVQNFLGLLYDAEFVREADSLAGYDISDAERRRKDTSFLTVTGIFAMRSSPNQSEIKTKYKAGRGFGESRSEAQGGCEGE